MTDQEWEAFGYDSTKLCAICGGSPTKSEPRFGYSVCRAHTGASINEIDQNKGNVCLVGVLTNITQHPNNPALRVGIIDGHKIVVGDHYEEGNRGFHIPRGAVIPEKLLREMRLWNDDTGKGRLGGKQGNVVKHRAIGGVVSDGLFYGAYYYNREAEDYDADNMEPITTESWDTNWVVGQDISSLVGIKFKE